jgi:AraC-like DNA-binding protein
MSSSTNDFVSGRFSTDDLPERGRLGFMREMMGRQSLGLDVAPLPNDPLRSEIAVMELPGVTVISGVNSGLQLERTRTRLADGSDDVLLCIQTAGVSVRSQRGGERAFGPGEGTLVSKAEICSTAFPGASRVVSVVLPRRALEPLVADLDDAVALPFPAGTEPLRLLLSYIRELEGGYPLAAPRLQRVVVEHIYALAALVVGSGREVAETAGAGALRAARLHAAAQAIRAGFADPSFSLGRVVRKLGLSPRYIQDLLHESGASFTERVLELRLQKALTMLADPGHDRLKIIDIALACGFNEVSYFNRAFRRRFGESPTQARRAETP